MRRLLLPHTGTYYTIPHYHIPTIVCYTIPYQTILYHTIPYPSLSGVGNLTRCTSQYFSPPTTLLSTGFDLVVVAVISDDDGDITKLELIVE